MTPEAVATPRSLHVVVPTVGRTSVLEVVRTAVTRETALARLTVVAQAPLAFPAEVGEGASAAGVVLDVLHLPDPVGAARARDLGALRGDEPWLGFLDDDIVVERGSLSDLVLRCERDGLDGACGVVTNAAENTPSYRILKRLLFRGIFRDDRADASLAARPVRSRVLSGGLTVYRRSAYERCRYTQQHLSGYTWGEDFELSYCVSERGAVMIDPTVRVRNEASGMATGRSASEVAIARLRRYRRFADRAAVRRLDWVHYLGVLVGVLLAAVRSRAGARIWVAVGRDGAVALMRLARPTSGQTLR